MRKIYISLAVLVSALFVNITYCTAQLTITPSATAAQLANKLVGNGVTIISPTLTCPTVANGIFVGPSTLSFDSGIVLTTGRAQTSGFNYGAGGPAINFASNSNSAPGDAQLTALAGQPTFDACVLQFDFRPTGDTIKFNYVFGSEEYPDFSCSSFNDVFGFFISGPGFASPTNLALVPGTTIPVCINSVNGGASPGYPLTTCSSLGPGSPFTMYYVDNSAGATITYDGLTTTLQAIAHVVACDTYHLKIGIADGTDHSYDSGVFLEAGSLTSTGINVTPLGMNSTDTTAGGQYCVRGCLPGQFVFNINAPQATNFTIHYIIGGSAIPGTDYTPIADSVVIPAGSTSASQFINPLTLGSGNATVVLYILSPYTCGTGGVTVLDTVLMNIYDGFYVHILTPDTAICLGQSANIISTGDTSLVYNWSPSVGGTDPLSVTVTPTSTTTYTLMGTYPGTGCPPSTDVITVSVINAFSVDAGADTQRTCVGVHFPLHAVVSAPGTYTYSWTPSMFLSDPALANPTATPAMPGDFVYTVTATEVTAGCRASDNFVLHVVPNDYSLLNPDTTVCFGAVIPMRVTGSSEFAYHWTPASVFDNADIPTPTANISTTTLLTLTASYPGCPDMVHTVNVTVESPMAHINTGDTMFCIGDTIQIDAAGSEPSGAPFGLSWSPTTYLSNTATLHPTFSAMTVGDFPYTLTITSAHGCTNADMVMMSPRPTAHITVTPGNTIVNYGDMVQLDALNTTSYPLVYYWTPNNGSLDNPNINNPVATMHETTTFVVYAMNQWGCRDSASMEIVVDDGSSEFVPTAFTPNGDGLNDVFRILNMRYQKLVMFEVYNRWGNLVYQNNNSNDATAGWDGTYNGVPQDMGVYNYQIIVAKPDGKQKMYKGEVTLIK